MLTTAVFSICITAPLGAIMINTLGTKWLSYEKDDDEKDDPEKQNGANVAQVAPLDLKREIEMAE